MNESRADLILRTLLWLVRRELGRGDVSTVGLNLIRDIEVKLEEK